MLQQHAVNLAACLEISHAVYLRGASLRALWPQVSYHSYWMKGCIARSSSINICTLRAAVIMFRVSAATWPALCAGLSCFQGVTPGGGSGCDGAPLLPILYVSMNLAYNISLLNLLRSAGQRH